MKIELHFHTKESSPCGKIPAREGVRYFKEAGYNGIAVTDHFNEQVFGYQKLDWNHIVDQFLVGYNKAYEAGKYYGIQIYLGMEIRFLENDNDYLIYGITEEILRTYPYIYQKSLKEFRSISNLHKLCVIQAHPFRTGCIPADPNLLDGVEVCNKNSNHNSHNEKAFQWAKDQQMIMTIGTDFHRIEDLQPVGLEMESLAKSSRELADMLKKGKGRLVN